MRQVLTSLILFFSVLGFATSVAANERYTYQLQDMASFKQSTWKLKDITRPTIVFFWASWCQYCRQVLPQLRGEALKKFDLISISCDEDRKLAIKANQKEYRGFKPAYWLDKKLNTASFVGMYPTLMIVKPGGVIDTIYEGSQSDKMHYFFSRLRYLMNESL